MTEARIGRVVVASLHEALAHQVPLRLEFYETYLRPMGMRAGTIGAASFTAALSFLRREPGGAYGPVVQQAGALAAEWTFANVPALRRTLWSRFPLGVRRRWALRLTARLVDGTHARGAGPHPRPAVVAEARDHGVAVLRSPPARRHAHVRVLRRGAAVLLRDARRAVRRPRRGVPRERRRAVRARGRACAGRGRRCGSQPRTDVDVRGERRSQVVLAALACLGATLGAAHASPRVFVMPFEVDAPTVRTYWAGEGAAILVADEIDALGADAIGRRERVAAFEDLHLPLTGTLTRATMIRVAEASGASDVVLGRILLDDRRLTLTARVLRLDAGGYLPDIVEHGTPQDLFVLSRKIAQRALAALGGRSEVAPAGPRHTPALEAFESYVKGLLDERPDARLRLFRAALARQPDFDRVWLAIWEVQTEKGDHQAALAAVKSVPAASARSRDARFLSGAPRSNCTPTTTRSIRSSRSPTSGRPSAC